MAGTGCNSRTHNRPAPPPPEWVAEANVCESPLGCPDCYPPPFLRSPSRGKIPACFASNQCVDPHPGGGVVQ